MTPVKQEAREEKSGQ